MITTGDNGNGMVMPVTPMYGNGNGGWGDFGSINDRMIDALERMMDTAKTEHERETIRKRIEEIRRDK